MALVRVNDRLKGGDFPDYMPWPTIRGVERVMTAQFAHHSRFMLFGGSMYLAKVCYGVTPFDGVTLSDGEARFAVWVESNPKRTAARLEVRRAMEGQLPGWSRPRQDWRLLVASTRAINVASEDEAVDWFVERLVELRDAGLFELLPTLGAIPPEEQLAAQEGADLAEGG